MNDEKPKDDLCPLCGKDMTIRAGAIYRCDRDVCSYWRMGFVADGPATAPN